MKTMAWTIVVSSALLAAACKEEQRLAPDDTRAATRSAPTERAPPTPVMPEGTGAANGDAAGRAMLKLSQGSPSYLVDASGASLYFLEGNAQGTRCDATCEQLLYLQRQLRESLGREKDRVDRVWLVAGEQPVRAALLPALQGATVLHAQAQALGRWLQPEAGEPLGAHLYLVDPMGRWMMRFPAELDPSRAKKDLDRLLRAAASWDRAGREAK